MRRARIGGRGEVIERWVGRRKDRQKERRSSRAMIVHKMRKMKVQLRIKAAY